MLPGNSDIQWCFSQVKGTLDDNVTEGKPGGKPDSGTNTDLFFSWYHIVCRVQPRRRVAGDRRQRRKGCHFPGNTSTSQTKLYFHDESLFQRDAASKSSLPRRGEYNVYSTFQSHEPEFDYLKSLEIEEKINKIRWLKRKNPAHFLLSTNGNN